MAYVSDRQIVEGIIPCNLMISVVLNGADPDQEAIDCIDLLRQAANEHVAHIHIQKERDKIHRRAERAYQDAARPWSGEGHSVGKFGLIVYYWLRAMLDTGNIDLGETGPFQEAMELLLPGLAPHAEIEALDASAQKQSRKFHERLQSLGYYRHASI